MLDVMAEECHENAVEKGFWPPVDDRKPADYTAKLMMVVTEVAEIVEAYRKNEGADRIEEEFADLIIRVIDSFQGMKEAGIVRGDLQDAVAKKMITNVRRPQMHNNLI